MNGQGVPQHNDRAIAALAERQHGVVAHRQLLALGLTEDAVDYRLLVGRLHAVHRGIYPVGHRTLTRTGRWMAAVLACGPAAVLSHRDAAALWLIRRDSRSLIEVTAPGRSRHARPGIVVHRPRLFEPDERTQIDGIPVTTAARTLVDLAGTLSLERLTRAWDESVRLGVFDLADLERVRSRFKRRRGLHKIDALIAQARPVPPAPAATWNAAASSSSATRRTSRRPPSTCGSSIWRSTWSGRTRSWSSSSTTRSGTPRRACSASATTLAT